MDIEQQEAEAKANAAKHVANMLQRTDQLDRVDLLKRREIRNKASVEAMLKTTMQSQLDGVKSGLNQLQTALIDIKEIKLNLKEMDESLQGIHELSEKLSDVWDENIKHSQYAAAKDNLTQIFNVPIDVKKAETWISDNKLLEAHYCLSHLENSRNELLLEMHKMPKKSPTDRSMLNQYFAEVANVSDSLAKQLWLILKRTLTIIRKEPAIIVTVLRIIEREEKADIRAMLTHKATGFLPPGRPKQWRQKAFLVLEETVNERIEGNQIEERKDNTMWLVRHLEITRQIFLNDMKVIKTLCKPCFPPSYDISNKFLKMYHECLHKHLAEVIANGLEGNEFLTLLGWLNTYEGHELLKHPDLAFDIQKTGPLLDNEIINSLQEQYLNFMRPNYQLWMKNTFESEMQEYYQDNEPEADGEGYFHTTLPVIAFQMVEQNLQVVKTINAELFSKLLLLSMRHLTKFGTLYEEEVKNFKQRYFEDRTRVKYFTHFMIAVVNNSLHFIELSHELKDRYWKSVHDNEAAHCFEAMVKTFQNLRDLTANILLDEIFMDLDPHFQDLMTKKWLLSSTPIDTICVTLEDYCQDYQHLRPKNFTHIMTLAQRRIVKGYLLAILLKRISFRNFEERKEGSEKIIKETDQLQNLMKKLAPNVIKIDSPYDILLRFAEILKGKDTELLSLELSDFIRKYPDVTEEHLIALLTLRGDIGWLDSRQLVNKIIPENKIPQQGSAPKSLLSEIELPTLSLKFPKEF